MTICYFGDFDPEYARNKVIMKGIRENGVEVVVCNDRARGIKKYINLLRKHKGLKYDLMIVGYSDSRSILPLAKIISRKRVIWDAFYSVYDSYVFDRKLVQPGSMKALYYWFGDWICCKLSDTILLDTNEHIKYFSGEFSIGKEKFIRVFIGADNGIFNP